MKPSHRLLGKLSLACAAALAGCASPNPPPVLLTLPPVGGPAAVPAGPSGPLLAVRRVGLPEYLVARRVRYRADPSTLAEWPNTYWAERIEIGVSREFIAALRQQLPDWRLCDATCGEQAPAFALLVDLAPMDYLRGSGTLQAGARISVTRDGANPEELLQEETSFKLPVASDTAQGQAAAVTALLRQVAAAAAAMVRNAAAR